MGLTFSPLHPVFAAECSGVDIGEPLSPGNATAIEDAKYPRDLRRTTLTCGKPAIAIA